MIPFVTLAALKAELSISGTDQDAQLGDYLDQASALVLAFVGRPLERGVQQDTFRRDGPARSLLLSVRPVVSIDELIIGGQAVDLTAGADFDPSAGILYGPLVAPGCWACGGCGVPVRIVVSYTAGYVFPGTTDAKGATVTTTLPASIQRACLDTAKAIYHANDRDPLVRSESEQGIGSTSWLDPDPANGGLPAAAAAALAPWHDGGLR